MGLYLARACRLAATPPLTWSRRVSPRLCWGHAKTLTCLVINQVSTDNGAMAAAGPTSSASARAPAGTRPRGARRALVGAGDVVNIKAVIGRLL